MPNMLDQLNHKRIKSTKIFYDYIQIYFDDNSILNIYNSYSINGIGLRKLRNFTISEATAQPDNILLTLSPRGSIKIGMKDSDYRGPEAMGYIGPNDLHIVWP